MRALSLMMFFLACAVAARAAAPLPSGVGYEQRIGETLPLAARFAGEDGVTRPLGEYFGGKPAVLVFNYFRCPQMCSLVSSGEIDALRALTASAGKDFTVISVSIDPTDTADMARARRLQDLGHYGRAGAGAGWHTLTGTADQIAALAGAAGFRFAYDPRSRQYAHPSGLVVVTPKGVVSSYFLGVDFDPQGMAAALRSAAANKTGRSVFSLLFVCFQAGSPEGQYGRVIWIALSAAVALTLAAVFGGIFWALRNERRAARQGGVA